MLGFTNRLHQWTFASAGAQLSKRTVHELQARKVPKTHHEPHGGKGVGGGGNHGEKGGGGGGGGER